MKPSSRPDSGWVMAADTSVSVQRPRSGVRPVTFRANWHLHEAMWYPACNHIDRLPSYLPGPRWGVTPGFQAAAAQMIDAQFLGGAEGPPGGRRGANLLSPR